MFNLDPSGVLRAGRIALPQASFVIPIAVGVGLLSLWSAGWSLLSGLLILLLVLCLPRTTRMASIFLGCGVGILAAVSDSNIVPPVADLGGELQFVPLKYLPYGILVLGAALVAIGRSPAPVGVNRPQRLMFAYLVLAFLGAMTHGGGQTDLSLLRWAQAAIPFVAVTLCYARLGPSPWLLIAVLSAAAWHVGAGLWLWLLGQGSYFTGYGIARLGGLTHPVILAFAGACVLSAGVFLFLRGGRSRVFAGALLCGAAAPVLWASHGRSGSAAAAIMIASLLASSGLAGRVPAAMAAVKRVGLTLLIAITSLVAAGYIWQWFTRGNPEELWSLTGRTYLWRIGWGLALERPFFGWGPGLLRLGDTAERVKLDTLGFGGHAHNALLEAVLASGFIGGLMWVLAFIYTGRALWSFRGELEWSILLGRSLWLGLVIYSVTEAGTAGFGFVWLLLLALQSTIPMAARVRGA